MASVNPQTVEQTKQQIRGLIGEISQLSKSDLSPEEFYAAFLQRVVQSLAAVGGAVWILEEGSKPKIGYQINVSPQLLDENSDEASKHYRLLDHIVRSKQGQLIPPLSSAGDERMGGNPTRQLLVIAPVGHDEQIEGLIEIFQRPDTQPATQRGYLRFLVQMCELAGEWFKNRKLRHLGERHSLWAQADQFSRTVHESLDLRETCYGVVNEGRRLLGVDRVSIGIMKGSKCVIEAISGQDTLDNRSNVVTNLGRVATRVVASGEPLWYNGDVENLPPQIEEALEPYVDESFTRSMTVLPLRRPRSGVAVSNPTGEGEVTAPTGEIIGALIIEQIESEIPREVLNPKLELVHEHTSRAITNSLDHSSLFLMPVWKTLGKAAWVIRARTLPKTIAIVTAVALLIGVMIVVPWDFDMKAKGEMQPLVKRDVYAGVDGQAAEVFVENGSLVKKGDVLCRLVNNELVAQLEKLRGEANVAESQLSSLSLTLSDSNKKLTEAERAEMGGRQLQLKEQSRSLARQISAVEKKIENLEVKSPLTGKVISWDVRKQLENRPVQVGQVLMTVADETQGWEVDLFMRQSRIGHLNDARASMKPDLDVEYILLSDPGVIHKGKVMAVDETSQQHEQEGHVVRVRVKPDGQLPTAIRAGTTVKADVNCGRAPVGWVLFHEAWEWLEANVFFW